MTIVHIANSIAKHLSHCYLKIARFDQYTDLLVCLN